MRYPVAIEPDTEVTAFDLDVVHGNPDYAGWTFDLINPGRSLFDDTAGRVIAPP